MSTPAILPVPVAEEEDITRQQNGHWGYNDDAIHRRPSRKGKEKESEPEEDLAWSGNGASSSSLPLEEEQSLNGGPRTSSYPPLNDEQEETRRIQENLRRMEQAELQRRKAARQSGLTGGGGGSSQSSIVENVTRRASLLWQNRLSGHHSNGSGSSRKNGSLGSGLGQHQKLPSTDQLPLTEIPPGADSPTASPTRSETNLSINTTSTITSLPRKAQDVDLNAKRLQEPVDDPFDPPEQDGGATPRGQVPEALAITQALLLRLHDSLRRRSRWGCPDRRRRRLH
ncbi:hypothetical protein NMY22_g9082 [Coprinellus aureogranulatus]|nr:hypothetical protein NMY22_g9082 [Coprinellus aureogranulatus]